jgi:hypothetical protein
MLLILAGDMLRQNDPPVADQSGGGFIARGFYAENNRQDLAFPETGAFFRGRRWLSGFP